MVERLWDAESRTLLLGWTLLFRRVITSFLRGWAETSGTLFNPGI